MIRPFTLTNSSEMYSQFSDTESHFSYETVAESEFMKPDEMPSLDEIKAMLVRMRNLMNDPNLSAEEIEARNEVISEQMLVGAQLTAQGINILDGLVQTSRIVNFNTWATFNALGSSLCHAGPWIIAGLVMTAQTGLDYRALQNGDIS